MPPLYVPHARALQTLHADLESYALGQRAVFTGTAGSVIERTNASGFRFYAHQSYDGAGKKREGYLAGPVGAPEADREAALLRARIAELKELVPSLRLLAREGFAFVDARTYATLAALHNNGLFVAGAVLVGSHAYGVLLNRLGIRARKPFVAMMEDSGMPFVEVPRDRRAPSTCNNAPGRSTLRANLLTRVPELHAHASSLPYLAYLLAESQLAMVMAREGCCTIRVPLPERYALHKLIVSRLRTGREAKSGKDVSQACVLAAALAELHPGALESALAHVPRLATKHLRRALQVALPLLEQYHPRAVEELS